MSGVTPVRIGSHLACGFASAGLLAVAARPWGAGIVALFALVPALYSLTIITHGQHNRLQLPLSRGTPRSRSATASGLALGGAVVLVSATGMVFVAYEAALGISSVAYVVAALSLSLPFLLVGVFSVWVGSRLRRLPPWVVLPVAWCSLEVLLKQEWLFGRFASPLAMIGYTQAETAVLHLARFGSVSAVSAWVLLANGLISGVLVGLPGTPSRRSGSVRAAAFTALILLWFVVWAAARGAALPGGAPAVAGSAAPGVSVSLLQPNIPATARSAAHLDRSVAAELLDLLLRSSRTELPERPAAERSLLLWPEAAWPSPLPRSGAASGAPATPVGVPEAIIGAPSYDATSRLSGNAAYLWRGTELRHVYDKRHTVPFTEDALIRGSGPVLVRAGGVSVAPLICYDVAFPATARNAATAGAELLVVLTDDTFAAGSHVPIQHLRVARFRAVETGLWLAFASNGGPSALIDPSGQLVASTQPGEAVLLRATARPRTGSTPYLRFGDWVGVLAWLLTLAMAGATWAKGGAYARPLPA